MPRTTTEDVRRKGTETFVRNSALRRYDKALADVERTGGRLDRERLARAEALADRQR